MISSLLTLVSMTLLTHANTVPNRTITCGAPLRTGALWYSNLAASSYDGQIGYLSHLGHTPYLAKYPNPDIDPLTISILPCDSTYLGAVPSVTVSNNGPQPVKLAVADNSGDCLGLVSVSNSTNLQGDFTVERQKCQEQDDERQVTQFWTMDFGGGGLWATWNRWGVLFEGPDGEVVTNGGDCDGCTEGDRYSILVKEGE